MPNAPTHAFAGTLSGGALTLYRARDQAPLHQTLEGLGGALAGYAGGKAPDSSFIDPASLGPNHRRFGHSWIVLAGGVCVADAVISAWERFCRQRADEIAHRLATDQTLVGLAKAGLVFLECLWRVAAGALAGFIAGYTSHLVLDAFTARSLPLCGLEFSETAVLVSSPPPAPVVASPAPSVPVGKPVTLARRRGRGRASRRVRLLAPVPV